MKVGLISLSGASVSTNLRPQVVTMAARRAAALLAQRLTRPVATASASSYNPAPLAASLALRGYR